MWGLPKDDDALRAHQQASLDTLAVLDRTRQIIGVRFPDDPWAAQESRTAGGV